MRIHTWLGKMLRGRPVIVVSGLPRSGTSMIMQMLAAGGAPIASDSVRQPDVDNPRGYHELEAVKDLDKGGDKSWLAAHKGCVVKVVSSLLKELPLNLNYRVVFVRRPLPEVLRSQQIMLRHRGEADGRADEQMSAHYESHLWRIQYYLKHTRNFETLFVDYADVVGAPAEQAPIIRDFLGLPWDANAMAQAVDPRLYRNRLDQPS